MKYYVVIDTNVLISALLTSNESSATVQILERLFTGVTGNIRHFPNRTYIVTARQMLDILDKKSDTIL